MLWLSDFDHGLLGQGRGRAGLDAGAAGHAFGAEKAFVNAGRDAAVEATAGNGQCKGALNLLAGANATRADDALGRLIGKIWIRLVDRHPVGVGLAVPLGEYVVFAFI